MRIFGYTCRSADNPLYCETFSILVDRFYSDVPYQCRGKKTWTVMCSKRSASSKKNVSPATSVVYLRCIRIFHLDFDGWQLEDENHNLQLII